MEERVNSDIAKLVDQTIFLLGKQKESKDYCSGQFVEFLELINDQINSMSDEDKDKVLKLKAISEIITHQLDEFNKDIGEDIDFLEDQLKAVEEIKQHKDPASAKKLLAVLMDGEKIPETEKFKSEVEEEVKSSKASFALVLEDLKNTLLEGGVDELLAYFQDIGEDSEEDMDDDSIIFEGSDECCSDKSDGETCCGGHALEAMFSKASKEGSVCLCDGESGCKEDCACDKDGSCES